MSVHHIDDYRFGEIIIDGEKYRHDLILLPERIVKNWWRDRGHLLQVIDLDLVMQEQPEALVIGQGAYSRMQVSEEVHSMLDISGIEWFTLPTPEACEKYNQLSPEKLTAAAFHITC